MGTVDVAVLDCLYITLGGELETTAFHTDGNIQTEQSTIQCHDPMA